MAVINKKRASAFPTTTTVPRKRVRNSHNGIGQPISIDELGWEEVPMPDRLDDVEGFMGMEEVEGIDVFRNNDGVLEYKVINEPMKKNTKRNMTMLGANGSCGEGVEEAEEWRGIDNEGSFKQKAKRKQKKQKEKKQREKKLLEKIVTTPGCPTENEFSLLPDGDGDVSLPSWSFLSLSLPIIRSLSQMSFTSPTPIQSAAIAEIIAGHDFIGKASTGSGKTLAFGIPILEYYLKQQNTSVVDTNTAVNKSKKTPIALILSPTRELAHQLHSHLTALAAFIPEVRIVSVTGGLSIQKQLRQLKENGGADVIIATPGRLWEVISEGQGWIEKLKSLKFLVVDEADRLLQEGHYKEVVELLNLLPKCGDDESSNSENGGDDEIELSRNRMPNEESRNKSRKFVEVERQTLVFSATFHQGLQQKLAGNSSKKPSGGDLMGGKESMEYLLKKLHFREKFPKYVDVNPVGQLAERLSEGIIECGAMEKDLYLYFLLLRYPSRTLIFANSISSVKRLAPFLATLQLPVFPLHSRMIQKARLRSLERFSAPSNPNSILIATDVAARGLDIKGVDMIVHYHLPRAADMYVHRSGRTARGVDARGVSVLLCSPDEVVSVRRLVGKVHESDITVKSTGRYMMKGFNVDRKLVNRLKPRIDLAKKIADSSIEKQKKGHEDGWLKAAAEELGVDYDSDEFSKNDNARRGRQGSKIKKDKAASATKDDLATWKGELNRLLKHKINSGFSERYLTSGSVNLAHSLFQAQLEGRSYGGFLGLDDRTAFDEVGS